MKARLPLIRPVTQFNSSINVTPLVDVVLVLLIIFMVVTPLLEKDLPLQLPATKRIEAIEPSPADQIIVRVTDNGMELNGNLVPESSYVSELRPLVDKLPPGKRVVFFAAADEIHYPHLIYALDGAKIAGAEVLGMTDPTQ